ncbi:MAG TPA: SDR family oxidoreductase [Solirubrobacteraceae bacterium]
MSRRVAVVTGGASGIGRATVEALLASGARVGAVDLHPEGAPAASVRATADVRDQASVDAAVERVRAELGPPEILVNCAGIGAVGTVEDGDDAEWAALFDVNVMGIVRMARACLPHLRLAPNAAIVNVSSVVATVGVPNRAAYSASKGAVSALTLAMATDLLADGVRVNCVAPGTVFTPWVSRLLDDAPDPTAALASLQARQPLGRLGRPEEIAHAILHLADPCSAFTTGTTLVVDGGMVGLRPAS